MYFHLYLVDDHKKNFYENARKEYEKRLRRYCKIKVTKVRNIGAIEKELKAEEMLIIISAGNHLLSSEALAEKIQKFEIQGKLKMSFFIGPLLESSFFEGMDVKEWSISPMEFSAGLLSTVLLEQIYRAYRIIKNEPYHK